MRILCFVLGILFVVFMFIAFMICAWTADARWGNTAIISILAAVASFMGGSLCPEHVPHNQKCSGC